MALFLLINAESTNITTIKSTIQVAAEPLIREKRSLPTSSQAKSINVTKNPVCNRLAITVGASGEGFNSWGMTSNFAIVLAGWMGATMSETCVSPGGRVLSPWACKSGWGLSRYVKYPKHVCSTSYTELNQTQTFSHREVVFLSDKDPQLRRFALRVWTAPLPRNVGEAVLLARQLLEHNISLALLATSPKSANTSDIRAAIDHPQTKLTSTAAVIANELFFKTYESSKPIQDAAQNFTASLGQPYLLAHWRVELIKPADAARCGRSLHSNAQAVKQKFSLPESTPLVLMSDARHESLCPQGNGLLCRGWASRGHYGAPEVRGALSWLREEGWLKTDELLTANNDSREPLLRMPLAMFLAEREIAEHAAVFVSCPDRKSLCWKCSQGRRSAGKIKRAREIKARPNWDWSVTDGLL